MVSALQAQTVEGDVVDAQTGAPIAGARVSANPAGGGKTIVVRTNVAGHFQFATDAASIKQVFVARPGYLTALKPCNVSSALRIELPPSAVITGRVVDEDGFPVARANVQAIQDWYFYSQRRRRVVRGVLTDDQGRYRLPDLAAGRYWITVDAFNLAEWDARYVPEYYPGDLKPEEKNKIDVKAGEEKTGIDIQLKRVDGVTISGRIVSQPGTNLNGLFLALDHGWSGGTFRTGRQVNGEFAIPHVPPGDYVLHVSSGGFPPQPGDSYAYQHLRVTDVDQRNLTLELHVCQPVNVSGKLAATAGQPVPLMTIDVAPPLNRPHLRTRTSADGSFILRGLLPGFYEIDAFPIGDADAGGYPVSFLFGDKDAILEGFEIDSQPLPSMRVEISARRIPLTGKLTNAAGQPAAGLAVIFISRGMLGQAFAATNPDGSFQAVFREPGDYHVYIRKNLSAWDSWDELKAHENDYPTVHVSEAANAPLTLQMK
jgi:hypothetical protein